LAAKTAVGGSFHPGQPAMVEQAEAIRAQFVSGLRKVAKAFDPAHKRKVKSHRDGARLVFWYE